jgi:replication factor A1
MSREDKITPLFEDLKKVLGDKVEETELRDTIRTYIEDYGVDAGRARAAIIKKYDPGTSSGFVTADTVSKKIGDLTGSEMNIDLVVKIVYVESREVSIRGKATPILSGIIGDDTGTCSFTIWDRDDITLIKGGTYAFRNAYTKLFRNQAQVNIGTRGAIEEVDADIEVRSTQMSASEPKEVRIGELAEGMGSVTVTGRITSLEVRNVIANNEPKTVYSGIIADETGKVQYSAWNDFSLSDGDTIRVENAYVRSWKGIPQLNMGDRTTVTKVDSGLVEVDDSADRKTVAEIIAVGGAIDVVINGMAIDLREGSGLIGRCPTCNRAVRDGDCSLHGRVEAVPDLRMKLIIDDGTGAMNVIVNRENTEELSGITLEEAERMAAGSDASAVSRAIAGKVLMRRVAANGNVLSDEYGPTMIVKGISFKPFDVKKAAEQLYDEMEAAL